MAMNPPIDPNADDEFAGESADKFRGSACPDDEDDEEAL